MSAVHGSKATLRAGTSAAATPVSTDLTPYANSLGATFNRDSAEVTTMASGSKKYIPGLKDATIPFGGPFDTLLDPIMWDLYDTGAIVDFEYCPAGRNVVGTPKYTGKFFVTSYEISDDVGDAGGVSGEFQVTGDVLRTVQ